uniref:Uncharacterized protein AlNc14C112G6429 n=1 Tax=Albugo laibachii Nc14 TaxID=890382 RepID=F0WIN0_9STRA|nr:conserved hypothetical protein [Albugo laibachii Nc14]|eukprot:CCA21121.1 conserved hypothetical protein [Albugo laibachii Nc14]
MSEKLLFGGSISCFIPQGFDDVSSFRQVPDHQEVYTNFSADQCIIVEILQYEKEVKDDCIAQFLFDELANENNCASSDKTVRQSRMLDTSSEPRIGVDCVKSVLVGEQYVAKFHEGSNTKNLIQIYLGVIRLPSVTTDIMISLSVPIRINPMSSSKDCYQHNGQNSAEIGSSIFDKVYTSFRILDWRLFG